MENHEKYIQRCLQLAKNGLGTTYPNPLVGSVIVFEEKIIGEGWHQKAGAPHAEVHAIRNVRNKALLPKATLYVNLEPCSHFGKTPPCSDLIIQTGIKHVVLGTVDPFSKVSGAGIQKLRDAGCKVEIDVLKAGCLAVNRRFFTFHTKQRPYIILKWAQSQDGYLSPPDQNRNQREPVWITNETSRQLVHRWRAEEQAILIGTTTALADNPSLTTRDWKGSTPVRILIDRKGKVPVASQIYQKQDPILRFVASDKNVPTLNLQQVRDVTLNWERPILDQLVSVLYGENIQSVIIEGGRYTLQQFIDQQLWDEARVFTGPNHFVTGTSAPVLAMNPISETWIKADRLNIYKND